MLLLLSRLSKKINIDFFSSRLDQILPSCAHTTARQIDSSKIFSDDKTLRMMDHIRMNTTKAKKVKKREKSSSSLFAIDSFAFRLTFHSSSYQKKKPSNWNDNDDETFSFLLYVNVAHSLHVHHSIYSACYRISLRGQRW